jgi:serine/threonine-protein kinase RsbW
MADRARGPLHIVTSSYPRVWSQAYPGRRDQAAKARAFVARTVEGCPAVDEVVLMAGELAANAILHSHSGDRGGLFTVQVEVCEGEWVRVQVDDEGGPVPPRLHVGGDGGAESAGRGLQIVAALADAWGVAGDVIGRTVWFRARWGAP